MVWLFLQHGWIASCQRSEPGLNTSAELVLIVASDTTIHFNVPIEMSAQKRVPLNVSESEGQLVITASVFRRFLLRFFLAAKGKGTLDIDTSSTSN